MTRRIQELGDTALLCEGSLTGVARPEGVLDIVSAFGSAAVHIDPLLTSPEVVTKWLRSWLAEASAVDQTRLVELPVAYDYGNSDDLEMVAQSCGLSVDQVVRRHADTEYTVGAIGFQPGFPYLEGLPPELFTPRRETPRARVPAGSVGIGGPYTGIYPAESPGGWNLIGRTPLLLVDPHRTRPFLLRVGDRVRFRPIDTAEFKRLTRDNRPTPPPPMPPLKRPLFRVVSPGVQSTVQGMGRYGLQHLGVSPGEAMDFASLRLANLLVGNDHAAQAIEATLVGPVLECLSPVTVGIAGAVASAGCRRLAVGERLNLRQLAGGAREYLALPGGVSHPTGHTLCEGDLIGSPDPDAVDRANGRPLLGKRVGHIGRGTTLRVLRGPQADLFSKEAWQVFLGEAFCVSPQSNRMGIRCEGPALPCPDASDLPSQPVCTGVVQVPPDGKPIALGADRQTLGGYPIIAVVISADWPRIGQFRPGDPVRFSEVDLPGAIVARQRIERELALAAVGLQLTAR